MKRDTSRSPPPSDLVDPLGRPVGFPNYAPEVVRCLCGKPAKNEIGTCGSFECGRY